MRNHKTVWMMLAALPWLWCGPAWSTDEGVLPPPSNQANRAVARLRIPSHVVVKAINQDFQSSLPVEREVLGTRARGTATAFGSVTCSLVDNPHGAEFECLIVGTVKSTTCGLNGPAIIHSASDSKYRARKMLFFDGQELKTRPAEVQVSTQLRLTGIGSTAPRLRGRIVRQVASRRAAEQLSEAEAITARLTQADLQQQIETEFNQRIAEVNQQLDDKLKVMKLLERTRHEVAIRTFANSIILDLYRRGASQPASFPAQSLEAGESIELWVPLNEDLSEARSAAGALVLSALPAWLAPYFEDNPRLSEFMANQQLGVRRVAGWLMLELR
jgi:hypothetical protein